jgi:hypothetical protein
MKSDGLVAVTTDRRLMYWTDHNRGGVQLTDALPPGNIEGVFADADGPTVYLVTYAKKAGTLHVLTSNLRDPCTRRSIRRNKPLTVALHQRRLLLIYANEVRVLDPETGEDSVYSFSDRQQHKVGRFYRNNRYWLAAGLTDFERVCSSRTNIIAIFDRPGRGPWRLLQDFTIDPADSTSPPQAFKPAQTSTAVPAMVRSVTASSDGNYLVVEGRRVPTPNTEVSWWVFDLVRMTMQQVTDSRRAFELIVWNVGQQSITSAVNLRRHFDSIGRDRQGRLVLCGGNNLFTLMENAKHELIWADTGLNTAENGMSHSQPFRTVDSADRTGYKLRRAVWLDGSQAWLDSRGMLHLVSSARRLPEITLTLGQQPSAGWTSDGQTVGWKYFVDETSSGVASVVEQLAREFAARLSS